MAEMHAKIYMVNGHWVLKISEPEWLVKEIVRQMEKGAAFRLAGSSYESTLGGLKAVCVVAALRVPQETTDHP